MGNCGSCGNAILANDRFCGECGAPIATAADPVRLPVVVPDNSRIFDGAAQFQAG